LFVPKEAYFDNMSIINQQRRERLTIQQKYEICMHDAKFLKLSQDALGRWAQEEFQLSKPVSQKTISNILNAKDKVFKMYANGNNNGKSSKGTAIPSLDNDILEYIQSMNEKSIPINRGAVKAFAKVIAHRKYNMSQLPASCRIKFSEGWLTKLFKRIGVKSRHLYGEESSVDLTSQNIVEQLKKIEKLLEPYEPKDILNFDETGLYYEQQPTRTICAAPMGGSKKSKNRLTVGLLTNYDGSYKGYPIVIGKRKTPRAATRKPALYRQTTNIGQSHYVDYHSSPNAWMTTDIFRKYIKRLNASFVYANRKVAILVDNASVHKLREEFSNIKLVFLPANTTSKLQPLDAGNNALSPYPHYVHIRILLYYDIGIIANFKAQFRWHQYYRAVNKHLSGVSLDHAQEYRMDEVDVLYFLADSWLKVETQTIQNCWDHTKILDFKFQNRESIEIDSAIPTFELPLNIDLLNRLGELIPDLPGNQDQSVTGVEDLDLNADESNLILCQPEFVEFDDDNEEGQVTDVEDVEDEEDEEDEVDVKEIREKLKKAYETILYHTLATDDQDRSMLKTIRKKLDGIRSEEAAEKKQVDVRNYFQPL
jgi:hypothetical protein